MEWLPYLELFTPLLDITGTANLHIRRADSPNRIDIACLTRHVYSFQTLISLQADRVDCSGLLCVPCLGGQSGHRLYVHLIGEPQEIASRHPERLSEHPNHLGAGIMLVIFDQR